MERMHVFSSPRLEAIRGMVMALSRASHPWDVQRAFAEGWQRIEPGRGPGYLSLSCRGLERGAYRVTRFLPDGIGSAEPGAGSWPDARRLPVHRGGILGSIITRDRPVWLCDLPASGDPVMGEQLAPFQSLLAIPLFDDGHALNWAVQLFREAGEITERAVEEALLQDNLVGGTVRHVLTASQLRIAEGKLRGEVQRIAAIQRALLPAEVPAIPGLRLDVSYETFDEAGGDLYAFDALAEGAGGCWGFLVGDVSGHGPAAAVVMAMVETLIGVYRSTNAEPSAGALLSFLNQHLCAKRIEETFVTAWAGVYDPSSRRLTYACAGHPPPLLRQRAGSGIRIEPLDAVGGLPLGILDIEPYGTAERVLQLGDTLMLYTDGLPESRSPDGAFFGIEGLSATLATSSGEPAEVIFQVRQRIERHLAGGRPQDDQTLMVLQCVEGAAHEKRAFEASGEGDEGRKGSRD